MVGGVEVILLIFGPEVLVKEVRHCGMRRRY